mmetsp:Transcript_21696/g.32300  ORF Transcript_21696/g.32300 Transcript_21696/m.32300 type:complete len:92 (-) Transcript_21696:233-508(-)
MAHNFTCLVVDSTYVPSSLWRGLHIATMDAEKEERHSYTWAMRMTRDGGKNARFEPWVSKKKVVLLHLMQEDFQMKLSSGERAWYSTPFVL